MKAATAKTRTHLVSTEALNDLRGPAFAPIPVVCIGLSSGGLEPLKLIFRKLSRKTGMAFVVIHHIHNVPTMLPEILSTCTPMHVALAVGGQLARPNHVYVLPSGKEITLADGFFALRPRAKRIGFSNVLTLFLESLAISRHPGVAVILSGVDADGAAALKTFRQHGGITIAQEPGTSEVSAMPVAAILTGAVDQVLTPEAIAPELQRTAEQFRRSTD